MNARRPLALLLPFLLSLTASAHADGGGTWQTLASMNVARQEHASARLGGFVFVVGGLVQGFVATDSVERYDIAGDVWTPVAPLPAPRDHLAVVACGGELYAIGGFAGDFVPKKEAWRYDPALDQWTPIAPLPNRRGGHWGVEHLGRIYVFGGEGPPGTQRSTFVYDPLLDQWSQGADMPTAREHLNAVSLGDRIHVIGGRSGAATAAHEAYLPELDAWVTLAPLPTARSAMACEAWGGRIYAMGGEIPVLHAVNESYDPATDSWSTGPPMPLPRHGVGAVRLDDGVLVPAGGTVQGLKPSAHVDVFRPEPCPGWWRFCGCRAGGPCGNAGDDGCPNSTGQGGRLTARGTVSVAADDLVLTAEHLPPNQFGLVFLGDATTRVPLADGARCVGGALFRLPVRQADASGSFQEGPGIVAHVAANLPITIEPGATWGFQAWYRDPGGPCGTGSNLTNAVGVTFVP